MAWTYNQLKDVNERVDSIELKGKAYVSVAARVQAFRELCPMGCISTDYDFREDAKGSFVICKTTVIDANGQVLATGMAYEREGSTQVNRTSYIENCETSAVGRALGMIGIGSKTSMASAEEMANAIKQQSDVDRVSELATYVDAEGEHTAAEMRDRNWKTIQGLFQLNGKTAADAQAWIEKRYGLPLDDIGVRQMADAKVCVARRNDGNDG